MQRVWVQLIFFTWYIVSFEKAIVTNNWMFALDINNLENLEIWEKKSLNTCILFADPKIEYFECDIGTKGDEYLIFNTLEMLH